MIEPRQPFSKLAATLLVVLYTLTHLLAALGLIAFGVSAGGYPLNRWGIYGYAIVALVALVLSLSELGRSGEGPSPLQFTLPPLLALWVTGLYFTTVVLRAEFAPYLDDDGLFAALNLGFALVGCGLALGYRWPKLLLSWAGGQGLLLLTNPGLLSAILRYGARWDREGLPLLLLPLAYGLSALALGYHVWRRKLILWLVPFVLAGMAAAVVPIHHLLAELRNLVEMSRVEMGLLVTLHGLSTIYIVALVLGLPFHTWGVSRTWPVTYPKQPPGRWAWPAFIALVYLAAGVAASELTVGQGGFFLPPPGQVQGWISQSHVVPDAYPRFFYWVPTLLATVRWLLLPVALMAAWEAWRQGVKVCLPARQFPALLVWPALASLASFGALISPGGPGFVLMTVWEDGQAGVGLMLTPLIAGLGLLGLTRLMETLTPPLAPSAGRDGVRALVGLATGALLAGYIWWQGQALAAYARVLLAPLPIWAERWKYAPLDPKLTAVIGLVVHSGLLVLGLWALGRTGRALVWPTSLHALPGRVWLRVSLGTAVIASPLIGFWYWWTEPGILEAIPPQGATEVPRDTVIMVRFRPESPLREFWSTGQGMSVHYADTQEYIPGMGGGWGEGMYHDPDGLLRPDAEIEAIFRRQGRRSFVLRFTTAGVDGPTATPLPPGEWSGFESPVPTQDLRLIPTTTPVAYPPTDWPRDISAIITCPTRPDTAEQCLSQEYPQRVQLVGHLIPAAGGFVLLRGPRRLPASLDFAEGCQRESIDWLCEHGYLTAVQGQITSLDPPTMLVSEAHGAASGSSERSTPLAELYTNPEWGMAIEYPSGWVVEPADSSDDPTAIYIQNFHSADVFVPLAGGAGVEADPSLYRVRLYPLPQEHVTTLEEARAGYEQGLKMRAMTINGLPTLRFRYGVDEEALVQLPGRVLLLSTRQDPALFERMLETLRPVPTEAPAATSTPVTPPPAYLTWEAARQATVVARATASPFPTAGPATVRTGQPTGATTRRDGLSFQVCLPKDIYLAGEGGQAEVTLRNDGPETVSIRGGPTLFGVVLLDEQGHGPAPWPWSPMSLPMPPYLGRLEPGQMITETLNFQVPPVEQATNHTYVLWAETRFSRPDPDNPDGPDNLQYSHLRWRNNVLINRVLLPASRPCLTAHKKACQCGVCAIPFCRPFLWF